MEDHNMPNADVVVIGAGLSGLSAAKILHERGLNVIVLEARGRVGGRTYTLRNEDVTYVDLGGSYVGPTQNRILRLADEFGIQTFLTQDTEDLIFHSKGRSKKITGAVPPVSGLLAQLDVNNLFRKIDEMGEEIPVDAPWDAPRAEEWDKMTVKEFFNKTIWTRGAWKLGEQTVNVCVTSESHEVSLLWFLWYLRQCGGSNRILSTDNGGQQRKFAGGSQQISERIAEKLGKDRLFLDHAVCSITQNDQSIQVSCLNGKVFKCRHVILAVPLPLQTRLTFDPPLRSLRNQLIQRVPMGSVIKTFVYYDRPFWQEKGHSGTAIIEDEEALVEFTFADTKPDGTKPAIMGLILAGRAKTCVTLTKEERRERICKLYARVFETDQALKYVHYEELNWLAEQWSGGCYSAMMPPGFLTTFGRELRKPVGRIHFAGTETATEWSGYMEGAVQAGERAAREILFERGEINQSEIWKEEPENKVVTAHLGQNFVNNMAASISRSASLDALPEDFSLKYIKNEKITLNAKQKGYKYFSEGYIHAVKMFRSASTTSISARCYRSQRKSEEPHRVDIDVGDGELEMANCSCTAGCSGCCSHIVGLVQALCQWKMMGLTEPPTDLSSTSLPKQWGKPRGPKVEAVAVPEMVVLKPKPDRKRKPLKNTLVDNRLIKVQHKDVSHLQSLADYPISYLTMNQPTTSTNTQFGAVPLGSFLYTQAIHYSSQTIVPVHTDCGDLQLPKSNILVTLSEPYVSQMTGSFTLDQAYIIEENTRDQADCAMWHIERQRRITASNFHKITNRKAKVTDKFVSTIQNPATINTESMQYGKNTERKAREEYVKKTHNHVHDCGFVVNPAFHFLGASPDGKICENGYVGILEIKCPHSKRNMDLMDACTDPTFCLQNLGSKMALKETHSYYTQCQGQLMVTGVQFCDFVVYTKKDLHIERIYPNIDKMKSLLHKLADFYFCHFEKSQAEQ